MFHFSFASDIESYFNEIGIPNVDYFDIDFQDFLRNANTKWSNNNLIIRKSQLEINEIRQNLLIRSDYFRNRTFVQLIPRLQGRQMACRYRKKFKNDTSETTFNDLKLDFQLKNTLFKVLTDKIDVAFQIQGYSLDSINMPKKAFIILKFGCENEPNSDIKKKKLKTYKELNLYISGMFEYLVDGVLKYEFLSDNKFIEVSDNGNGKWVDYDATIQSLFNNFYNLKNDPTNERGGISHILWDKNQNNPNDKVNINRVNFYSLIINSPKTFIYPAISREIPKDPSYATDYTDAIFSNDPNLYNNTSEEAECNISRLDELNGIVYFDRGSSCCPPQQ